MRAIKNKVCVLPCASTKAERNIKALLMSLNSFIVFFFFGYVSFTSKCFSQDSLVLKTFLNGKFQILVPKSYKELSQAKIVEEYPDPNVRPSIMLTDDEEFSSLKIIMSSEELKESKIVAEKGYRVMKMRQNANIKLIGDGVKKINGNTVGFIKIRDTDKNTFAYFFFTSMNEKLLLFVYNCVDELWPTLEGIVEKIVNSLKVE
jgi:hypothetical protein